MSKPPNTTKPITIDITKVVPQNKNVKKDKVQKSNISTDLNALRKSKGFRALGDAFDYFD